MTDGAFLKCLVSGLKLLSSGRERMIAVSSPKRISIQEFLTTVVSAWAIDFFSEVKIISRIVDSS